MRGGGRLDGRGGKGDRDIEDAHKKGGGLVVLRGNKKPGSVIAVILIVWNQQAEENSSVLFNCGDQKVLLLLFSK